MPLIRAYRVRGEMNGTEKAYANHLKALQLAGDIEEWVYEPETFKIGPDCRYTPDFRVLKKQKNCESENFYVEFHEVKGTISKTGKPYIEDDALVKIKTCSTMHPYKFIIVWKYQGEWKTKEIN